MPTNPLFDPYTTSMSILKTIFEECHIPILTAKRLIKACKDLIMQTDMWHMHNNKIVPPAVTYTDANTYSHGFKLFSIKLPRLFPLVCF